MLGFIAVIAGVVLVAFLALAPLFGILVGAEFLLRHVHLGRISRFLLLVVKSVRRNPLRTSLSYLAAFVLVAVVTMVWSALYVLDHMTEGKARDIKVIVSEKWQDNSEMPFGYARPLSEGGAAASGPDAARPDDAMTWQFYVGTLDPQKRTRESLIFFFAVEPRKVATLMDRVFLEVPQESRQQAGPKLIEAKQFLAAIAVMEKNKRGVIIGRKLLGTLNKQVGERMKVSGINYKDLDLEVEIVGMFPDGRYNDMAVMHRDYLNDALDVYPKTHGGQPHPMAQRSLNFVVLQVSDLERYSRVTEQIDSSGMFQNPAVKCQTLAAYAVTQLDSFRDILWAMRWLLSPAILVTMALVIANSIGISMRERRKEIAVLKVLGYRPRQILSIVLGEAMLLGALSGFLSTVLVYQAVNRLMNNNDAILPVYIPDSALWWGPSIGVATGLVGSLVPAWGACRVRVSEVFARVA
jgi:putative ABC transport system permease protein